MEIPVYTTMKQNRNRIVIFLLILQLMLICVITRKWLLVSTQRLYLEDRKDDGRQGVAWQRFVVENESVLPQIITRNNASMTSPGNSLYWDGYYGNSTVLVH